MLENLSQDIRYALRSFRKTPAFTLAALGALTIGIGANTAIFSVVDQVLLKPLPYPDPSHIVSLLVTTPQGPYYGGSAAKYNVWRSVLAFQEVAAYEYQGSNLNVTGGSFAEEVHCIRASADYFDLFGASMVKGRRFTTEEDRPNGGHVAVLSYGLWQRRFGGDDKIVGKSLLLSGVPYEIAGVVGLDFNTELESPPDVFLPFQIDSASTDHAQYFNVVARLRPGITISLARAQLQLAAAFFRQKFPNILGPKDSFSIQPFQEALVTDAKPPLVLFTGAVVFVLLIACANVANLLLIRGTGRKREVAIRSAVGAGRGRIVRQLLTESIVLSMFGGILGLLFGLFGVQALIGMNPGNIPRIAQDGSAIAIDWRLLLFTVLLSGLTGVLFGLIPALGVSREDFGVALKEGGGRSGTSCRQSRIRSLLVASETALALILLIGAGLLIRSFFQIRGTNRGIDIHRVLTLRTSLTGGQLTKSVEVGKLVRQTTQRLENLPGVQSAAASYSLPLDGAFGIPFNIAGRTTTASGYDGRGWLAVAPGYFNIFKISLVRGRVFSDRDDSAGAPVAVINETMARRYWPSGNPIGSQVLLGQNYGPEFKESAREIVGVVGDVLDFGSKSPQPVVYVPVAQVTDGITALLARASSLAWIVRTRAEPHSLEPAIKKVLQQATNGTAITKVRSMEDVMANATAAQSFQTTLLTIFATAALLLAAIGMYGMIAFSTQQRTHEIGIRLALGAEPGSVRNMVMFQGIRWALLGSGVGMGASLVLSRVLAGFLFGVKAWDALTFCSVPLFLIAVLLLAVWIPSRRAARVDPLVALRHE